MREKIFPEVRIPNGEQLVVGRRVGQAEGDLEAGDDRLLPLRDDLVRPAARRLEGRWRLLLTLLLDLVLVDQVVNLGEEGIGAETNDDIFLENGDRETFLSNFSSR